MLGCLAPLTMEKNLLDEFWDTHFVDRRVKNALLRMTGSPDKGLVRLLRKRVPRRTPRQIRQSLRRLTIRVELPAMASVEGGLTKRLASGTSRAEKGGQTHRQAGRVSLSDLIAAGVLQVPPRLYGWYKGRLLDATLTADGKVEFQGTVYKSCSAAPAAAQGTVVGDPMRMNGWWFWQYEHADSATRTLEWAREAFERGKNKG